MVATHVPVANATRTAPSGRVRLAIIHLLTIHAALLAWSAHRNAPVMDELGHLPSGISHWKLGRFEMYRVNPPLVRSLAALPVLMTDAKISWNTFSNRPYYRSEFPVGLEFFVANGDASFWYFTLARWACIPLSLLGGWVCWRWARDLYGTGPGLLALVLWCFSPNILAWSATICPDTGSAAVGVLAGYCFWKWLREPGWWRALLAGLTMGLAELTKTTWIVLFGLWPMLWLVWRLKRSGDQEHSPLRGSWKQLAVMLLLALDVLNTGYGFEGTGTPLGEFRFISRSLGGPEAHTEPGNRFRDSLLGSIPVPLPENYVRGIDVQKNDFEKGKWSYLRGEQRFGGWWYYYLYAMAVKLPLGTLLLVPVAIGLTFTRGAGTAGWRDELVLLIPAVTVLVLVSSQLGFNRYLRYVLPALPFLFIWISQAAVAWSPSAETGEDSAAASEGQATRGQPTGILNRDLVAKLMVLACVIWSVASSLWYFPHSMSYFNELGGGPLGGHAHLVDANIDWGQDLLELKRWMDEHPEARPMRIAWFGFVPLSSVGLQASPLYLAGLRDPVTGEFELDHYPPGWYAISVNHLRGYLHYGTEQGEWTPFQALQPDARAGYSIYIYHLEDD